MSTLLDAAKDYTRQGWRVIPIPHQSKAPRLKDWPNLWLTEEDLPQHFNGQPQNIGVLLGEPSGWLIDIDLDHRLAVDLAVNHLPPTPAVFGREGKPCSHYIYRVNGPVETHKFSSKTEGMLVEVRSTGQQTVLPPSTHVSGEKIEWEHGNTQPALVDPKDLIRSVEGLAQTVREQLGEAEPASPCLESMLRMDMTDGKDGSKRLYAAACRVVEHGLSDEAGIALIRQFEQQRPFPRTWTDEEILQRIRDAEQKVQRGEISDRSSKFASHGERDPESGKLVLSLKKTLPTAEAYVKEFHAHPEARTLHCQNGLLLQWEGNRFAPLEDAAVKHILQPWLHDASMYKTTTNHVKLVPFESNPRTVNAALESIRSHVHLSETVTAPCWFETKVGDPPPDELLVGRSKLLHLPTGELLQPTPRLFSVNALAFDPDPQAQKPTRWLNFLDGIFDNDTPSIELLQDWFGYCLTSDTSQQKMLLIIGPTRSGKGTIARVLKELVGAENVCAPTTGGLAGQFGLQPLIGKTLAIVSDARFCGKNTATVVERLLCISGEDALTVERKHIDSVTLALPTRFMFLSNELPRLSDASGALTGRFVVLRTRQSFFGAEDHNLTGKLLAEKPGILNWAIEGWKRLKSRGRFNMPSHAEQELQEMRDLGSPVGMFVRDKCEVGDSRRVKVDVMYTAWEHWCHREGHLEKLNKQTFGRDLAAAIATVRCRRGTGNVRFYDGISLKEGA